MVVGGGADAGMGGGVKDVVGGAGDTGVCCEVEVSRGLTDTPVGSVLEGEGCGADA